MKNGFFKGHGLGNDYIVMDPGELTFKLTPGNIRKICDRNWGIGSDGILELVDSKVADFGLRIWNPDGSEAEKSGNGLRIFARYLHATRKTRKKAFSVDTKGGLVQIDLRVDRYGDASARDHFPHARGCVYAPHSSIEPRRQSAIPPRSIAVLRRTRPKATPPVQHPKTGPRKKRSAHASLQYAGPPLYKARYLRHN